MTWFPSNGWLAAVMLPAFSLATRAVDLENEARAASAQHAADFEEASKLALSGEVDAGNQSLLKLIERDKSPAMMFVVANLLYKMDPATSYALHKKVYEALPGELAVDLEWAMEHHRKGEYAEAIPLYEKFLGAQPGDVYNALLAECLLRQGRLKEAVAAWEAAGHPRQHTGIDFAICEIHGAVSPLRRRADLLQRLVKGESAVAEPLVDLDLNMDEDWWNGDVNRPALDHDLPLIEKALGSESARWKEIRCWVTIASLKKPDAAAIIMELKRGGLIVAGGRLPGNSLVASRLMATVLGNGIERGGALAERFGTELLARARSQAGDAEALNALCGLSVDAKAADRVREYDRYGFERYGEFRFLGSLVAQLEADGKLTFESPELKSALERFPENGLVYQMAFSSLAPERITKEMLVAAIKAEFHKLSPGAGGYPDSYTLKRYFFLLKEKL